MSKTIIFDTEATGIKEPVLIEAAWVELESIEPFTVTNPFVLRYNPGKPITLGALATHHIMDEELVDCPPAASFTLPDGTKTSVGVVLPATLTFGTAAAEIMECVGGSCEYKLDGTDEWKTSAAGESFQVPANSKFDIRVTEAYHYICHYA